MEANLKRYGERRWGLGMGRTDGEPAEGISSISQSMLDFMPRNCGLEKFFGGKKAGELSHDRHRKIKAKRTLFGAIVCIVGVPTCRNGCRQNAGCYSRSGIAAPLHQRRPQEAGWPNTAGNAPGSAAAAAPVCGGQGSRR